MKCECINTVCMMHRMLSCADSHGSFLNLVKLLLRAGQSMDVVLLSLCIIDPQICAKVRLKFNGPLIHSTEFIKLCVDAKKIFDETERRMALNHII